MENAQPTPESPAPEIARPPRPHRRRRWTLPPLRLGPPFWTIASALSLLINIILIVLVISLGTQVFALKKTIQEQVLGGLYENFIRMDQATIKTTIPVSTSVPAKFDLPLKTNTTVILTEDTTLDSAKVAYLSTGGLTITNAPATIVLPKGTRLPVALDLSVPVDQMIPVTLSVDVSIPLRETELHAPLVGLQEVVRPYYNLMSQLPGSWGEALCGVQNAGCAWFH